MKLPILCSECPGWVCYSEKTLGNDAIPFMSVVKSPQQLAGRLVKGQNPDARFVTIEPCFDKKLEAVRPQIRVEALDEKA